jgi:hypothetical protein
MSINLAPIALFVYKRPEHVKKTVAALVRNEGAINSILHVFSDAARTSEDIPAVTAVRQYLPDIKGFKEVIVHTQIENLGLARSIISGVSSLCNKYGRAIVLEDDLVTSPFFLTFMNEALDFYENTPEVMHISGCRYPVNTFETKGTFFLNVPLCWGWATWKRAWDTFDKNIDVMQKFDSKMVRRFDFNNTYAFWKQLELNKSGVLDTWFVFWYANLFFRQGLALFPARSLVQNIGMDNSGTNSGYSDDYKVKLSDTRIRIETIELIENDKGYEAHSKYFKSIKMNLFKRILIKVSKFKNQKR